MIINSTVSNPTTEIIASINFETALSAVCLFAESDLKGDYFSQMEVEKLEIAARLIREKLSMPKYREPTNLLAGSPMTVHFISDGIK